jgi:glycosyltransferase involved in cell wall biosynthesis
MTGMESLRTSLVIPAYNEEKRIRSCLESVRRNGSNKFHEVVVIDNASTDRTGDLARDFSFVKVVSEHHKGLTHARERGRQETAGDLIAYLDADCELPDNWTEIIEEVFSIHPDAVALSGPSAYTDCSWQWQIVLKLFWTLFVPPTYFLVGYVLNGANFVVRRNALDAIGGFNRMIPFYGEDTDLARRLHNKGKVIFRLDFKVFASARRFVAQGVLRTSTKYALNYFWPILFKKPFSSDYSDIR